MRKLIFFLPVLFILLLSCNNDGAKKSIIGKWKMIGMDIPGMNEEAKKELMKNSGMEFRTDSTYTSIDPDGNQDGTYSYNKKNNKITVKPEGSLGDPIIYTISWKGNNLVLSLPPASVTFERE